jgi:hypothetical protein
LGVFLPRIFTDIYGFSRILYFNLLGVFFGGSCWVFYVGMFFGGCIFDMYHALDGMAVLWRPGGARGGVGGFCCWFLLEVFFCVFVGGFNRMYHVDLTIQMGQ